MTLAETAKAYRELHKLKVGEAANKARVSVGSWYRIENGELPFLTHSFRLVCRFLNYSADAALGLTGDEKR